MNGDTVILPIYGTIRTHEWQPAKAEPGKAKAKPDPRADSIEARILVLLAATPEGLTALEVRTALQASKDAVASKLSRLVKLNLLITDGKRLKKGRVYKLKQKLESPNGL
jgi:hypothetical protein